MQYTYNLNKVIRYAKKRDEKYQTQSVAEHVTNMLFCAYYFRDLEDPKGVLDFDKIVRIIIMHDMGEIETGDVLTTNKKSFHIENERIGLKKVKKQSPTFIARELEENFMGFEFPKTAEEKFAKAIDKFEGLFFWFSDEGIQMIKTVNGNDVRRIYFKNLEKILSKMGCKYILKYMQIAKKDMIKRGVLK